MAIKNTTFEHPFHGTFADQEDYQYVRLPSEDVGGLKVLYVLDYMPKEDLESGTLLSGDTGMLLDNLMNTAQRLYLKKRVKHSWLAMTYNAFKTAGRSPQFQADANMAFTERVNNMITKYKPDLVIGFGPSVMRALIPHKVQLDASGRLSYWVGMPVDADFKYRKREHSCKVVCSLSLSDIATDFKGAPVLAGYVARNIANGLNGDLIYKVDAKRLMRSKPVLIDTVAKFDKLMKLLSKEKDVAVDTEATSLGKVVNKLLTVQLAKCEDYGYIIPIYHKDTPFTPKELAHVTGTLRAFFEGANNNDTHIYCNAKFDLTLLRSQLGCQYMANDVWDVQGGEFALDENLKVLANVIGSGYYALANLCVQYGFEGYLTAEFGKNDRMNIENMSIHDKGLQKYCAWDVTTPFAIKKLQQQRAKDQGYKGYDGAVRWQLSDTSHGYSCMEYAGAPLDTEYLFKLKLPTSPIEQEIAKMEQELYASAAVKKANMILAKRAGAPMTGLFRKGPPNLFSISKPEHRALLFFDVLKLEPVEIGKGGAGKIDKVFQKKYASVPEVAMFTKLGKAQKLRNAYVNSFIKQLGENPDIQSDHRIRPNYSYLKVVTWRTSASDPNLQQVPAHSELGKHIKRLFAAPKGQLWVKVDYRVHEVRCWGLISSDKGVADLFLKAKKLRDDYRLHPDAALAKRIKLEADVHVMNASYFFRVKPEEVDKPLRNRVKGVIFGLIYQMSINSLSKSIELDLDDTKKLVANFTKRFPNGMKWIESVKEFARKNYYVESPFGCRRNLWGYLLPTSQKRGERTVGGKVHADMDRRAVNSPVQGMGAQCMSIGNRQLDRKIYEYRKAGRDLSLRACNSVHDSLETLCDYKDLLLSIDLIEDSLTTQVRRVVQERYGFDFVVDLEIDFEIGPTLANTEAWDFSIEQLDKIVIESLLYQRNSLGHKIDVDATYDETFAALSDAPVWFRKQVRNLNHVFELREKTYLKSVLTETLSAAGAVETAEDAVKAIRKAGEARDKAVKAYEDALKNFNSQLAYLNDLVAHSPTKFNLKLIPQQMQRIEFKK